MSVSMQPVGATSGSAMAQPQQAYQPQQAAYVQPAQASAAPVSSGKGEEEDKEPCIPGPQYKLIMRVILVLGIIFGLIGMILAIDAFVVLQSYTNDFTEIIDTWQSQPIVSVEFTNGTCAGNGEILLETVTWPGTYDMCDCYCCFPAENCTSTLYETSSCSSTDLSYGCVDIPGVDPVLVPLFDYNYKVCADYDGKSAKNRPEYNDGCDSGYVACGGADGTFQFCAETSAGCPVTDFLIDYEDADLMAEADEATMGYHDGVGQLYLYTKKGGAFQTVEVGARVDPLAANFFSSQSILGFPLIDVVVQAYVPCYGAGTGHSGRGAEYDGFANAAEQAFDTGATCTDYSYSYYTGYFGYPGAYYQGYVQRSQQTGCSAQADTRYRAAYYASEQALFSPYTATYTSGDVVDYIPSQYLTADDSFMYYMAWQTETQWNEDTTSECPNRQTVIRNEEEVNNLYSAQLALIVLTIISFLIIGLVGAIANFVWIGNDDDGRIGEGEPHYDHLQWMKYGKWALKIGMYTCTIITIVYAFGVVDMFIEVSDGLDCTDSLSINTFTSLGDIVEELASKDVVVGVMNSADGISDGFGSVIGCL